MPELRLEGCRLEPLGSYLKALGVLRLVGEQADHDATGWWHGDRFVLRSQLDREHLLDFLAERYRPTPIVTPWNKGSGFGADDPRKSPAAVAALRRIADSTSTRLDDVRETIAVTRRLVTTAQWERTIGRKDAKPLQVALARATLPDRAVRWIDGAVVLAEGKEQYPPLFGTGGNVGRLDFSKAYFDNVADVVDPHALGAPRRSALLIRALFGEGAPALGGGVIGQFDPGGAGGANSGPLGDAGSLVNPWDYVLLFEGGLLFAGSVARRAGSGTGRAAVPFMVASSPVGYPTGAEAEDVKGELWAPVWARPTDAAELERFMGEGRTTWNGKQATSGLEAALAIASLGVDRGIGEFVRHAFVVRHGQNALAVPSGRFIVTPRPEAPVLSALDPWLRQVRRIGAKPVSLSLALRRVDEAMIGVAAEGKAVALQEVLISVATLERIIARSKTLRKDHVQRPVDGLPASAWLRPMDDRSAELRLAAAFSSQFEKLDRQRRTERTQQVSRPALSLRSVQLGVSRPGELTWSGDAPLVGPLGHRPLRDVLADFLVRRAIDVQRRPNQGEARSVGVQPAFAHAAVWASDGDLAALVNGEVDHDRLGVLIEAMLLLDWTDSTYQPEPDESGSRFVHPALALLGPFFVGQPINGLVDRDGSGQNLETCAVDLRPEPRWCQLLANGTTAGLEQVVESALRRLRIEGLSPALSRPESVAAGIDPRALAVALAMPINLATGQRFLSQTVALSRTFGPSVPTFKEKS